MTSDPIANCYSGREYGHFAAIARYYADQQHSHFGTFARYYTDQERSHFETFAHYYTDQEDYCHFAVDLHSRVSERKMVRRQLDHYAVQASCRSHNTHTE